MIDSRTKQQIIDAAQILDVVSDFVSLRRSGVSYVGLCPFHSDRRPSFYVSPAKNVCKCFSCGEGGSPIHFLMKHEQMTYTEALRYLAKKYHIEIVEREETDEERAAADERQSLFIVNEFAQDFFAKQLHDTDEGQHIALAYFRERGIRPETIKKFGLGYSPEHRSALTEQALKAGYTLERLIAVGLSSQYEEHQKPIDRFRGRVIFPVRNLGGKYVAFGGRIMGKSDKIAKYVNSPESPIYSKSRELYGLYWAKSAISKANKCYLVEGYTDVISMHQSGIENVVASSGTALTVQQIRLIRRFTEHVTILYDGDNAGIKAALRGIDLLLEEGLNIKVVLLPQGEDPDSYARSHSASEFLEYLDEAETDFIHFKINLYQEEMRRDPLKRAELISDILRSIALIPDGIRRAVLIQSSAAELRMDEQLLVGEIQKLRLKGINATGHYVPSGQILSSGRSEAPRSTPQTSAQQGAINPLAQPTPAPISVTSTEEGGVPKYELEILKLVIGHGEEPMLVANEEEDAKENPYLAYYVADFIYRELELDEIFVTLSEATQQVIREACNECIPQGLDSASHFINHPTEAIRRISTDVLSNPYSSYELVEDEEEDTLLFPPSGYGGRSEAEEQEQARLLEEHQTKQRNRRQLKRGVEILKALDNLRIMIVMQQIKEVQTELLNAQRNGANEALIIELMQELSELNQVKTSFAQSLGERTIIG
ncbi:DNA primase [Porphyromonas sp. COT-290 OH3588]|uniref:DNA primase n=1 Tax=Porphyromonas sp. COT-290 OH3588 TaxID=1515617 RepID=UPI00052DE159|nr:DNA primase [Porphyromonas sp. COT-290 OH3588]KGO00304.1 DNA primase [Porphyromonas sp. COT-290 OH3588]